MRSSRDGLFLRRSALLLSVAALAFAGCSPAADRPAGLAAIASGGGHAGDGGGGAAGGASDGGGGRGGAAPVPAEPMCDADVAFWPDGMSFVSPTPERLALALSDLAYAPTAHPITIVLRAGHGPAAAVAAASATEAGELGAQVFPAGSDPTFVPAALSAGGFETAAALPSATLRLEDAGGALDLTLSNVVVRASTQDGCALATVTLAADIPVSEGEKRLRLDGGDVSIADLAGEAEGAADGPPQSAWSLQAIFAAESTSFDFSTLP